MRQLDHAVLDEIESDIERAQAEYRNPREAARILARMALRLAEARRG